MPALDPILAHVVPFTLVVFRLAGLFVAAPLLMSVGVPARIKAMLAVTMALAVYPTVPASWHGMGEVGWAGLLGMGVGGAAVGLVMGVVASVPILCMDMAGVFGGQVMGLGLARVYNPEMDTESDVTGQLLFMLATGAFVVMGGLEWLFVSLARTFETLPPGGIALSSAPLAGLVGVIGSGCELAIRVTLPIVAVVTLLVLIFGAIGKTMPQINVMSVGFSVKVVGGLMALAASVVVIERVVGEEVVRVLRLVGSWAAGAVGVA